MLFCDDDGAALVRCTSIRAGATSSGPLPRTLRVPLCRIGWAAVAPHPDLEAFWGGWG
ncbi:MAG: hypothetical protein Q4G34_10010 [Micrococcus sp.]|nr:hypothetical protein [Micrococcus sp.]